jgi:methylmalonyl-CoA mutase cobalamin-binding subunit
MAPEKWDNGWVDFMVNGLEGALRDRLALLSFRWRTEGLASREQLLRAGESVLQWKKLNGSGGLWANAPRLFTATLDDGIGQGLDIIHLFARVMGMTVTRLGLLQKPQTIVAACRRHCPEYLGLTMLQLDSEDELTFVGHHLPAQTRLIAGGSAFKYDPEMAARCGVFHVAANVAHFIDLLLTESQKDLNSEKPETSLTQKTGEPNHGITEKPL